MLDPRGRTVHVCRGERKALLLTEKDIVDGEDVVPGFSVRVCDLFG